MSAPTTSPSETALRFARSIELDRIDEDELAAALRDVEGERHHLALVALRDKASRASDAAAHRALAALLPTTLAPEPASALLLAELYTQLWRWLPERALPPWRRPGLDPTVHLAWLRAEACTSPQRAGDLARTSAAELATALEGVDLGAVDDPARLIEQLAADDDPQLQTIALTLTRQAIERGAISPEAAHGVALRLLRGAQAKAALELLTQPWCLELPLRAAQLSPALGAGEGVARAALRCAAARGLEGPLRAVLGDEEAPPRLRQEALRALGPVIHRSAIPGLLSAALGDPRLLTRPFVDALTALHRRGAFITDDDVPALLQLYAQSPELSAEELVELAYTSRGALFTALRDRPPLPLTGQRRIAGATALARAPQGATPLPVRPWLVDRCLDPSGEADDDGADPHADDPDRSAPTDLRSAALLALAQLHDPAAERLALARMDRDPESALRALRHVGGEATVRALAAALGVEPEGPTRGALLPCVRPALDLLWQLSASDPARRAQLLERLDEDDLTPAMLGDLDSVLSAPAADLIARRSRRERPKSSPLAASIAAIQALCRSPQAAHLPGLLDPLDACLRAVAAGEVDDESLRGEARRVVPRAVLDALRGLGAALHRRGRIRPTTLLHAAPATAPDHFTAGLLLELLPERRDPSPDTARVEIILRTLADLDAPQIYPAVLPWLRADAPMLRKLVLPLLARHGGAALATSVRVLTRAGDEETLRQAVITLGELRDPSGAQALIAALEHRNMNIKRAAAAALGQLCVAEAIPRLIWWLGHHDNPGLRQRLIAALRGSLGQATSLTLLAAVARADTTRRRGLLLDALAPDLDPLAIRTLLRADVPWLGDLIARIPHGRTLGSLGAELEAAGHRPTPAPTPARNPKLRDLALDGPTPDVEAELLALRRERPLAPAESALLAPHLAAWMDLAAAAEAPLDHLRVALDALPRPLPSDLAQALCRRREVLIAGLIAATGPLAGRIHDLLNTLAAALPPAQAWLLGVSLRDGVRRRHIDHSGRSPLSLLRRCGIALVRRDIDSALANAERSPDPSALRRQILADAFLHDPHAPARNTLKKGPKQALERAVESRESAAIGPLRATWRARPGATKGALIDAYVRGDPQLRPALLDWLCELQPPSAALREELPPRPAAEDRRPRPENLDQPLSAPLLRRLCGDLDDPERRIPAATTLLERARSLGPDLRQRLLLHFLDGDLGDGPEGKLPRALLPTLAAELSALPLRAFTEALGQRVRDRPWLARLRRLFSFAAGREDRRKLDHLLATWPRADLERPAREALRSMIRAFDRNVLRIALQEPLLRGEWGTLDLLEPPLRPSTLDEELLRATRPGERERLAELLGDLRRPRSSALDHRGAAQDPDLAEATESVGTDGTGETGEAHEPPRTREELMAGLREADRRSPQEALVADLKALGRAPDPAFIDLCRSLVEGPHPRLRLAAYRQLRRHGSREDSRAAARVLLGDPRPDVQRSAIGSLAHARDAQALPMIVDLLGSRHNNVRKAAFSALKLYGPSAAEALQAAMRRARPDHRRRLEELAAALRASAEEPR